MEKLLEFCSISANKNTVAGDTSAITPGGIRFGTPAVTTRNMKENDMVTIAKFVDEITKVAQDVQASVPNNSKKLVDFIQESKKEEFQQRLLKIRRDVEEFAASFPFVGIDPLEYSK